MSVSNRENITFRVDGMHCTNCALGVRKALEKEGFTNIVADFASNEVSFDVGRGLKPDRAAELIRSLGYRVQTDRLHTQHPKVWFTIEKKFWVSFFFTLPLLLAMFTPFEALHDDLFQLALTIPVYLIGFFHFGRSALMSMRSGIANMDVLIFLGSTAAFIYSLVGTLQQLGHDYMFYETSASIIAIVLLGNMLENRSVKKTTSAIDDLVRLQSQKAKRISMEIHEGQETIEEVDVSLIREGDYLLVNTGDGVPVDGVITWGQGSLDERMVSGESLPIDRFSGDRIVGGTTLLSGNIKMKATAVGENTLLSQIIEMVKSAQKDKPSLQNLADKISMIFVPTVVGLALLTTLFWLFLTGLPFQDSLMRGIAVLVIACPCALGLAIPTAVVVGLGRSAKNGILIRGGSAIDKMVAVNTVVFDKTGTLTNGKFRVKRLHAIGTDDRSLLQIVYSLEKHSSHPIAKAIIEQFRGYPEIRFEQVEEQKGLGVVGLDAEGNQYAIGSYRMVAHMVDDNTHNLYVTKNGLLAGWLDIEDQIKPEAKEVIHYLNQQGIKTILLSGDSNERCSRVAGELGISEVYSEKMPAEKLAIIETLSAQQNVAMVGDGINDAPALARAFVGISMSDATHVAVNSASIVLLKGDLKLLKGAFVYSRTTLRTIKENLFWAFFYNVSAIPLAMVGLLTPIVAAAAMAASDVIVVLNSLRLKRRKIR